MQNHEEATVAQIRADLPNPGLRMTAGRKKIILEAISHNVLTRSRALLKYNLSPDELESWEQNFKTHGRSGLLVTRLTTNRRKARQLRAA